jgi:sporulation protein YlmC with PRC-barrel domain
MSELDLALGLLDHQLVDSEGRNCGNADDLELDLDDPGGPLVAAILSGPQAWRTRGRLARAVAGLFPHAGLVRIPWAEVDEIEASIRLRCRAHELGLAEGDRVLGAMVERLPGGRL